MKKVFLYKEKTNERDCCVYIEAEAKRFECGHYFSGVNLQGACFSGGIFADYKDIKTILTENEYKQLIQFNEDINKLGYGITKGDERYNKGIELCKAIQPIYDKLLSKENEEFFKEIQEEEKEYLMENFNLDDNDIETIFDSYGLDFKDRAIIICMYSDVYDLGYNEAWSLGYVNDNDSIVNRYFDFESFGEDLKYEEYFCELADGRIVSLAY